MIGTQAAIEAGFDRISEFSEFRHGNDPEIHHSDLAWLRFLESGFISFSGHSGNSEILSTRLPSIETNGSPWSAIQSMAFPCLIAVRAGQEKKSLVLSFFMRDWVATNDVALFLNHNAALECSFACCGSVVRLADFAP